MIPLIMFGRSPLATLEPAHRALAQGRYEAAFALLESAASRQRGRREAALLKLYLAAVYALYGEDGLEGGLLCLSEAVEIEPRVVQWPLYRALYWEFGAYRGDHKTDVKRGALAAADPGDAFASYHAASALVAVGAHRRAIGVLLKTDPADLPEYLMWRRWSLLGRAYEEAGDAYHAVGAFEQSVALSHGDEHQSELVNLAASLLEAGRAHETLAVLDSIDKDSDGTTDSTMLDYLEGRAHLQLGNPNEALHHFLQASAVEEGRSFGLRLALAQTYATLGDFENAARSYREAAELAPKDYRAFALHEYAFTLFEAGGLLEAKEVLLEVLADDTYAYRAEAYADLAEVESRLGNSAEAEGLAHRALDLGAVASACLCLGHLAYDYCHWDEAIEWFERTVSASGEGEADWLVAQEMLADALVQQGYREPERIILCAEGALKYLHPSDEWAITLRAYVDKARELLGGYDRLLN